MLIRIDPQFVKDFIEDKGGVLAPDWKYTKSNKKFWVSCEKGHKWETCWNVIQSDHWCPKCAKEKAEEERKLKSKKYEVFIRQFIADKEGKLDLNWEYINNWTKFWIECKLEHRWQATWQNLKQKNCWCPYCHKHSVDEKFAKNFIEKNKKGQLPENWKYVSAKTKFLIICKKRHNFLSCWDKIRADHWCPKCRDTKVENEFRGKMEQIFSVSFPKIKPEWLKNPLTNRVLELDGFNQDKKIAFEYQGFFHYENAWTSKIGNWENQKKRDEIKVQKCKENNVLLIVMPYWVPKKDWEIEIKNQIKRVESYV